jgi:hypothetical protein
MRMGFGRGAAAALALTTVLGLACGSRSTKPGTGPDTGGETDPGGGGTHIGTGGPACGGAATSTPVPGTKVAFGTQGPWPTANCAYTPGMLQETWVVDATTDEAQNRWIATPNALYLATPDGAFKRYDELDGLHLGDITGRGPGPIGYKKYCDDLPIADDAPCSGKVIWGGANSSGIRSLAGGAPNEVFVGYHGSHTPGIDCGGEMDFCDPMHHSGKVDRVKLNKDGTITVDRIDNWSNDHAMKYWHNLTPFRLLYDHVHHPGTLYEADDHGILIVFPDKLVPWTPALGPIDPWLNTHVGDHAHAEVCFHEACNKGGWARAGDWRGLALNDKGQLWHAGQWTAGLITWDPDPVNWWGRWGAGFEVAFGDPYTPADGFANPPVFKVPLEGDNVNLTAVSVCPDGRVWFSTSGATSVNDTVAVFDQVRWTTRTFDARTLGLPDRGVEDLVCMPDGRLVVAGTTGGVVVWDPASGVSKPLDVPGTHVNRLSVDTMATPASLLVSTDAGAAVLRQLP